MAPPSSVASLQYHFFLWRSKKVSRVFLFFFLFFCCDCRARVFARAAVEASPPTDCHRQKDRFFKLPGYDVDSSKMKGGGNIAVVYIYHISGLKIGLPSCRGCEARQQIRHTVAAKRLGRKIVLLVTPVAVVLQARPLTCGRHTASGLMTMTATG